MRRLGGRYRLDKPVGRGGMAVVWRGQDAVLRRTVAVKMLSSEYAADPRLRQRVQAEAHAAAQLSHPHVANVYDFGECAHDGHERVPYLVMEFIEGETLADLLRREGALPWPRALAICADVASALSAAHDHGLVHRDVKPGNVMLGPHGVKVVDFGIAVDAGGPQADTSGNLLGTPSYIAPEQLRNAPAAPASDMYAFGLMLHECLTGVHPEPVRSVADLVARRDPESVPEPPAVAGLPADVAELCRACLAPLPQDRPASERAARILADAVARARLGGTDGTVRMAAPAAGGRTADASTTRAIGAGAPAARVSGRRGRRGRRVALLSAGPTALLAAVLAAQAVDLPPAGSGSDDAQASEGAGTGCTATYAARHRPDGSFTGMLTVTNTGERLPAGWSVTLSLPDGLRLDEAGGGRWSQREQTVTIVVDQVLPAGDAAEVTLHGSALAAGTPDGNRDVTAMAAPSGYALDGTRCDRVIAQLRPTDSGEPTGDGADGRGGGDRDQGPARRPVPGGGPVRPTTTGPQTTPPGDASPSQPPASPSQPEPTPSEPDASASEPEPTPSEPDASPSEPEPTPSEPDASASEPEPTPSQPASTPTEPTPTEPEITPTRPPATATQSGPTPTPVATTLTESPPATNSH